MIARVVLPFLSILLLSGCFPMAPKPYKGVDGKSVSEAKLSAAKQEMQLFDDVPVARGFTLQAKQSHSYKSSEMRYCDLHYFGRGTVSQVVAFYREEMGKYGWKGGPEELANEGVHRLAFTKGKESCIISLVRDGSHVRVRIKVIS